MRLSDCKTFSDVQLFCDQCVNNQVWWIGSNNGLLTLDLSQIEFCFNVRERRLKWKIVGDKQNNDEELYGNEDEANLDITRQQIKDRENSIVDMTEELRKLKEDERTLVFNSVPNSPPFTMDKNWLETHGFQKRSGEEYFLQTKNTCLTVCCSPEKIFVKAINNKTGKTVESKKGRGIWESLKECIDGLFQISSAVDKSVQDIINLMGDYNGKQN